MTGLTALRAAASAGCFCNRLRLHRMSPSRSVGVPSQSRAAAKADILTQPSRPCAALIEETNRRVRSCWGLRKPLRRYRSRRPCPLRERRDCWQCEASRRSCVAITMVVPSLARRAEHVDDFGRQAPGRAPKSVRRTEEPAARARAPGQSPHAAAGRLRELAGQASALCSMPTFVSNSMARALAFSRDHFCTSSSPSMTFSMAVRCGKSWKF